MQRRQGRWLAAALWVTAACAGPREQMGDLSVGAAKETTPLAKSAADATAVPVVPTRAEKVEDVLHGVKVADPYRWLENEKSPEVQQWMRAQDDVTRKALGSLPTRAGLVERFTELYYLDSLAVPEQRGGRYFYLRTHKDREKGVLYWRAGSTGKEHVLLDPNGWSKDGTVSLGTFVPSWDGKKVVFSQKPHAADEATLHVIDVDSGEWSKVDVIPGAKYASPSWTPDSRAFYYAWLPTDPSLSVAERPGYTELRRHVLGESPAKDLQVHPRTGDPSTFLNGAITRDGKVVLVDISRGWTENDVYFQRLGKDAGFQRLVKGSNARYSVDYWKDHFYVLTDEGAPNGRVFRVDLARTAREQWKEIVPEDKEASLQGMSIVGGRLALDYLHRAASELRVVTLEGAKVRTLALPGLGTASNLHGLEDEDEAFFKFTSFTVPPQVFRTSLKSGKTRVWSKVEVPVDPSPYVVEQVSYPSKDGTQVSMFLVHRKGLVKDGSHPTLLYGYGGFNVSVTSQFSALIYPWLEAGGVYASPNLRGGGEYGKAWHDGGRGANKQNVFDDFIGAAEYLVREGYTQPRKLAIRGGSNGGLLVGAAMTQRPDLFGAVLCAVPLLDMLRYEQFGSGRTWIPEYGAATDPTQFATLRSYSPYHRVKPGVAYPALLMLSADHDDRVDPMHARKFVAAVQASGAEGARALLRIEANAGHGGADRVRQTLEASADQLAFIFHAFGMSPSFSAAKRRGTDRADATVRFLAGSDHSSH